MEPGAIITCSKIFFIENIIESLAHSKGQFCIREGFKNLIKTYFKFPPAQGAVLHYFQLVVFMASNWVQRPVNHMEECYKVQKTRI